MLQKINVVQNIRKKKHLCDKHYLRDGRKKEDHFSFIAKRKRKQFWILNARLHDFQFKC